MTAQKESAAEKLQRPLPLPTADTCLSPRYAAPFLGSGHPNCSWPRCSHQRGVVEGGTGLS
jgi:hypothetical protein